jgi:hypothetical protein
MVGGHPKRRNQHRRIKDATCKMEGGKAVVWVQLQIPRERNWRRGL